MKTIFFDLDDTIYDTKPIYGLGIKLAHERLLREKKNPQINFEQFQEAYNSARIDLQKIIPDSPSKHSRILYFKKMLESLTGKTNPSLALALDTAYAEAFQKISVAPEVLLALANKYPLGIITNQVCLTQLQKLSNVDPNGTLFRYVITSEEVGVEKPNPKIFLEALARAKCKADEAVMVGDDWNADILGAAALGITCVYVSMSAPPQPPPARSYWIKNLSELPEIVCKI